MKQLFRFEFTDEEQLYWTVLRHAHAKINEEGLRGLEEVCLHYFFQNVQFYVETNVNILFMSRLLLLILFLKYFLYLK